MEERSKFEIGNNYVTFEVFYHGESFGFNSVYIEVMLDILVNELMDDMEDYN